KGTGRARQGSIRSPHMTGGGVVHGPTPRDYSQRTPKKMKAAALRGALSDRARNDRIHVVAELVAGSTPSTKAARATLAAVSSRKNLLVVIERANDVAALSVRNITNIHVLYVDQLNTYDVLVSDDIVFTKAAFDIFVSGRAAAEAFASSMLLVEELVSVDADDEAEGTIKGNKDSMKYHVPGSRWYDATVAEVWFATVEEAKAAGFVPAGGEAAQTIEEDAK
ncbi:MAG: 50S ribosomal protein L4, partial [Specibacter sp.]